jgi:NAD+ kinase
MSMPLDLVLVRHGHSEGNHASELSKKGDHSAFTEKFRNRHSSLWRLSDKGVEQAEVTGAWIRQNLFPKFDRFYVSDYLRAQETAGLLELPNALWRSEIYLRERNWGDLDRVSIEEREARFKASIAERAINQFYWRAPNGESMADVCMRVDRVHDTLHRECEDKRVIAVCHGEIMWGFRIRLERMLPETFMRLETSHDVEHAMSNCQILHYTRRNPHHSELSPTPHFGWMRSLCPCKGRDQSPWKAIDRVLLTNEDLLARARSVERILN